MKGERRGLSATAVKHNLLHSRQLGIENVRSPTRQSKRECHSKLEFLLVSIYPDFMKKQLSDITQQWQQPQDDLLFC